MRSGQGPKRRRRNYDAMFREAKCTLSGNCDHGVQASRVNSSHRDSKTLLYLRKRPAVRDRGYNTSTASLPQNVGISPGLCIGRRTLNSLNECHLNPTAHPS
jgi:hypothetical protein